MIKVLEPSILVTVPEADENERKLIKFAKKNVPYYNPSAGYAYSEFTGRMFVIKERNVMALKKVIDSLDYSFLYNTCNIHAE